jgi:repressor of nif and glnA expression
MNFLKETDTISILKVIENSREPLETKEIEAVLKKVTRTKILYRLNNLRAEGLIKGKQVGAGKGTWIWWKK